MPFPARNLARFCTWSLMAFTGVGCNYGQPKIDYFGEPHQDVYKANATEIDHPVIEECPNDALLASQKPHTIRDRERTQVRDLSLVETIHLALQNSEVIRSAGTFLALSNPLMTNPDQAVQTVYNPAIQESGVLFGGRGVEAALADFDVQYNSLLNFGGNQQFNNSFGFQDTNTAAFTNTLSKNFATGGQVNVFNNINYLRSNAPGGIFGSNYSGSTGVTYRQPLLAGAGTQYTRTAGPISNSFGGISGVSQGVLVARINNDLAIADFEIASRNLMLDVENAYWDLYYNYRVFDTAIVLRNSSLDAWRLTKKRAGQVENVLPADEAQARNTYYAARSVAESAQSAIFTSETRLRRLLGLPVNDGTVIRPIDEPVTAEVLPDWNDSLSVAMTKRVELRRQKWNIKSLELQLCAAESLTKPRLDAIGGYQVNAFGENLFDNNNGSPSGGYFSSLGTFDQTGWQAGLQMNVPLGFRAANSQVRNYELRVARARKLLAAQELEVGHELAAAFQEVDRAYQTMRSNYLRFIAAEEDVAGREPRFRLGEELIDVLLRAYERRAQAEQTYYQSVTQYNQALAALQLRRGTLLEYNGVHLSEGPWVPEAYGDAQRQHKARAYATPDDTLYHNPPAFAADHPVMEYRYGAAQNRSPEPAYNPEIEPMPEPVPTPADEKPRMTSGINAGALGRE
ncbi:MAG TPA: TolC family protein [Caulifigura sp.]|nr:TolC family protein [Caulifigura sp.]